MDSVRKSTPDEKAEIARVVLLVQGGDEAALSELIDLTQTRLYRFCLFLTHNPQLAQDLCQDTFVKTLEKIHTVREPQQFVFWLLKTAKRLFLDYLKTKKNHFASNEEINDSVLPVTDPADRELAMEVQRALNTLKPDDKLLILLVDLEGYSYAEAAHIMGVSEAAVRSRIYRAREAFSNTYDAETNIVRASSSKRE